MPKPPVDIVLIANVGQRDLQLDGKPLDKARLREEGERLGQQYSALKDRLSAPMLMPALEHIRRVHPGEKVRDVVLVATDQVDGGHRDGDTIGCARVLARLIKDRLGRDLMHDPFVISIPETPHLYDRMLEFYEYKVMPNKHAQGDRVYLLTAGGTPACNMALLLEGVRRFQAECQVIAVEDNGVVFPVPAGERVLDRYRRARLEELLERRDFGGIAAGSDHPEAVQGLAESAAARLNLDFKAAYRAIQDVLSRVSAVLPQLGHLIADATALVQGQEEAVLREVYWNARVRWHRNEVADFLGRVWRLLEATLYRQMGAVTGIDFSDPCRSRKLFASWADPQTALMDALKQDFDRGGQLDLTPTTKMLKAVMGCVASGKVTGFDQAVQARLREVLDRYEKLERASELRNRSVIAHGFKGLSRDLLLTELKADEATMQGWLRDLLEVQGIAVGDDPYAQYAAAIRALDRR